jgi:hypothetical protein
MITVGGHPIGIFVCGAVTIGVAGIVSHYIPFVSTHLNRDSHFKKAKEIDKQRPGFYEFYVAWIKENTLTDEDLGKLAGAIAFAGLIQAGESANRDAQTRHDARVWHDEIKKRR